MTSAELKRINTEISDLESERVASMKTIGILQRDVAAIDIKIKSRKDRIKAESQKDIIISEHAQLRYFERVEGRDMKLINESILSPEVRMQIESLGSGKFPIEIDNEKFTLVVKNRTVVTLEPHARLST